MEDLVVACPLVPGLSRLVSGSYSSPRAFVPRFLQTPPRGDALALPLSFASTWLDRGLSPPSIETCPAHTPPITCRRPTGTVRGYSDPQAGGGQVERKVRRHLAVASSVWVRYRAATPHGSWLPSTCQSPQGLGQYRPRRLLHGPVLWLISLPSAR